MRILFVCPNLQAGGAERHWSILLPRLQSRGFEVRVLTLDGRGPFFDALERAGVPTATVANAGSRRNVIAASRMLRLPTDVIISRATSADGLSLIARAARSDVRWAVNWHHPTGMPISTRRRRILRAVLPRADAIIAVCASQIDELAGLGVHSGAITVVANGTDFQPVPEARAGTRCELRLTDTDIAYLLVGRLNRQKRVDRFIDAVARAGAMRSNIVGLVAGIGSERDELESQVARVGARVRFLGRRDDMPNVLSAVDVLCLLSDHEALPFVVLEAMASALPVIATRVGGLTDVVDEAVTGTLVDAGDIDGAAQAMLTLAADPHLRTQMGRAGHSRQQRLYAADPMADAYAHVLAQLVAGPAQ
ncbi:MAG: glycosyltransferase family 4 protein [Solirubrobacteraceae bacterium]